MSLKLKLSTIKEPQLITIIIISIPSLQLILTFQVISEFGKEANHENYSHQFGAIRRYFCGGKIVKI